MAKWKRTKIGDVVKDKEDKTKSYLKVYKDHVLKDGQIINLESKNQKLKSLKENLDNGRISDEKYEEILAIIEKMPDFVLFEAFVLEKQ